MPNSTTGLQPYQLMFQCKAQTLCDNWLGLNNYDSNESVSKSSWIHEHHKLMQAANQHALKSIQKSAEQSAADVLFSNAMADNAVYCIIGYASVRYTALHYG